MFETIKDRSNRCQAIKTAITKNSQNVYDQTRDFLNECTDFVRNINDVHDSPWFTQDYIRWAKTESKIRLGKAQCTLLRFLQYRYFKKGQPCFVKQAYIAKQLDMDRTHVNKVIKALVDKGLILRIQWIYKSRRKNTVLLPLIPSISPIFTAKNVTNFMFLKCHMQRDTIFCKSPEPKGIPKSLLTYTNIIYTNNLFNNTDVSIKLLSVNRSVENITVPTEPERQLKVHASKCIAIKSEKKGTDVMNKFLLKRKQRSVGSSYQKTFDALKYEHNYEIDYLDAKSRNDLITYISHYHFIDLRTHFKISDSPRNDSMKYYYDSAKGIRKRFVQLIVDGHKLNYAFADHFIAKWNALAKSDDIKESGKKISRINLNNKETKTYTNSVIAITYALIYRAKSNMSFMLKIPDRLAITCNSKKPPFNWKSKITIEKFLNDDLNENTRKALIAYLSVDADFQRWAYNSRTSKRHEKRIKNALPLFNEKLIDNFYAYNNDLGKKICHQYYGFIKKWLEKRIIEIVDNEKRKMYGYSLVFERKDPTTDQILPSLVDLFFHHLTSNNGNNLKLIQILDDSAWKGFIENYMQTIVGINDFYEIDRYAKQERG